MVTRQIRPPPKPSGPPYLVFAAGAGALLVAGLAAAVFGGLGKGAPVVTATPPAVIPSPPPPPTGGCPGDRVLVPGGTFVMGSKEGVGDADEHPSHSETMAAFCMDKTEVTVAAYRGCVDKKACTEPNEGGHCNSGVAGRDDHPINCVDWTQSK